jgi:hypothetical protein
MTSGVAGFGGAGYTTPQTRALSSIAKDAGPDLSQGQEAIIKLLQQHSSQLRFLAANQKQLQKGVNDATQNPIQQIQQFIADIIVLLGGGELATGLLDFGDLQYILPVLGALFGFDADSPFPISLFDAAEKFFLGYVVPNAQFADVINKIIEEWAKVFGIDPKFVKDVKALITAFGDLFDGLQNLLPSLNELFGALGISGTELGPLGQALAPIIKLFSGIDLKNFGNAIEFITSAIDPFIVSLTAVINFIDSVLAILGFQGTGSVVNSPVGDLTNPIATILGAFSGLDLSSPGSVITSIIKLIENLIFGASDPGFPYTFPITWDWETAPTNPIAIFFNLIRQFFPVDLGDPLTTFQDVVDAVINLVLSPQTFFQNILGFGDQIQEVLQAIENAFLSIPFVGIFAQPIFDAINGLLGIGQGNSTRITQLQNQINPAPVAGGVSVSDTFDRVAASTLGSSYDSVSFGPGTGTWGTDGSGNAHWSGGTGGAVRSWLNRHLTPLATRYQSVSCVQVQAFGPGDVAPNGIRLQGRMNAAKTSWVECRIYRTGSVACDMWYFAGGGYHQIGSTIPISSSDPATSWELRIGDTTGGDRNYRLFRNGNLFTTWLESGTGSVIDDVNNLFCSHQMDQGLDFLSDAITPPDLSIFAFSDRAPSS